MSDSPPFGFLRAVETGADPRQVWREIRDAMTPDARETVARLQGTELGRAALVEARQEWESYGLPPPWEAS